MKQTKKDEGINVHDDNVMRKAGFFRPFDQSPRDPEVWTKSAKEKHRLWYMKNTTPKKDGHFLCIGSTNKLCTAKLIIYLKKNNVFDKSTYSVMCSNTKVPEILNQFQVNNKKTRRSESVILKYKYNGKTYAPEERLEF